jgi:hypothetical protein
MKYNFDLEKNAAKVRPRKNPDVFKSRVRGFRKRTKNHTKHGARYCLGNYMLGLALQSPFRTQRR